MILLTTFLLLTGILFALFWGGSMLAQGYLYQQPASNLPIRAIIAAVLVAAFLAFWVWLDQRKPGKYDTFFEFAGETAQPFEEFEAVRWHANVGGKGYKTGADGKPAETKTAYKKSASKADTFVSPKGDTFVMNDASSMTSAILVKAGEGGEPARFDAEMKEDPRTGLKSYTGGRVRFVEADGDRYIWADQMGVMYVPNTGVVIAALLINVLLFVVWFAAFWPVLQFTWGHALGFAAVFGLVTMLIMMPLLFKPNRVQAQEVSAERVNQPGDDVVLSPSPPQCFSPSVIGLTAICWASRPPSTLMIAPVA